MMLRFFCSEYLAMWKKSYNFAPNAKKLLKQIWHEEKDDAGADECFNIKYFRTEDNYCRKRR